MLMRLLAFMLLSILPNLLIADDSLFDAYSNHFNQYGVKFDARPHVQIYVYDMQLLNTCNGPIIPYVNKMYAKDGVKNVLMIRGTKFSKDIEDLVIKRFEVDQVVFIEQHSNGYLGLPIKTNPVKYHLDFAKKKIFADFGMSMSEVEVTEYPHQIINAKTGSTDISFINKNILHIGIHKSIGDFIYLNDANSKSFIILNKKDLKHQSSIEINRALVEKLIAKGWIKDKVFLNYFNGNPKASPSINNFYNNSSDSPELILSFNDAKHIFDSVEYKSFALVLNLNGSEIVAASVFSFDKDFSIPSTLIKYDDKLLATLSSHTDSITIDGTKTRAYGILAMKNIISNENKHLTELKSIIDNNTISSFKGFYSSSPQSLFYTDKYVYYYNDVSYPSFHKLPRQSSDFADISIPLPYGLQQRKFVSSIVELRRNALLKMNSFTQFYATTSSIVCSDSILTFFSYINSLRTKVKELYFTSYYDDNTQKERIIILENDDIIDCYLLSANDKIAELLLKTSDNNWILKNIEF